MTVFFTNVPTNPIEKKIREFMAKGYHMGINTDAGLPEEYEIQCWIPGESLDDTPRRIGQIDVLVTNSLENALDTMLLTAFGGEAPTVA